MNKGVVVSYLGSLFGALVGVSAVYFISGRAIDIPADWWLTLPSLIFGAIAGWLGQIIELKIKGSSKSRIVKVLHFFAAYCALGGIFMFCAAALFEHASLAAFLIGLVVSLAAFAQSEDEPD